LAAETRDNNGNPNIVINTGQISSKIIFQIILDVLTENLLKIDLARFNFQNNLAPDLDSGPALL
jgi:hypothetical protein